MSNTRKIIAATLAAVALSVGTVGLEAGTSVSIPMTHNWCC